MDPGQSPVTHEPRSRAESALVVVLATRHPLMRASLRRLLDGSDGIVVAAEAADLALTAEHVAGHRPDVLVVDLHMSDGSSLEAIGELRERSPETRIVVLGSEREPGFAQRALAAGASTYVLSDDADRDLAAAVRSAVSL
jgi:DNA-binding NarL/FixJ family response regulator